MQQLERNTVYPIFVSSFIYFFCAEVGPVLLCSHIPHLMQCLDKISRISWSILTVHLSKTDQKLFVLV